MNEVEAAFTRVFARGSYRAFQDAVVVVDPCHVMMAVFRDHPEIRHLVDDVTMLDEEMSRQHYFTYPTLGEPCILDIGLLRNALDLFEALGWGSVIMRHMRAAPKGEEHRLGDVVFEMSGWSKSLLWEDEDDVGGCRYPQPLRLMIAPRIPLRSSLGNDEELSEYQRFAMNRLPDWVSDCLPSGPYCGPWFNRVDQEEATA
jgi:hypothetical protein